MVISRKSGRTGIDRLSGRNLLRMPGIFRQTCMGPEDLYLEFKIGIFRMYVLQDIVTFMRNPDQRAEYAYGAKLKFVHTLEI